MYLRHTQICLGTDLAWLWTSGPRPCMLPSRCGWQCHHESPRARPRTRSVRGRSDCRATESFQGGEATTDAEPARQGNRMSSHPARRSAIQKGCKKLGSYMKLLPRAERHQGIRHQWAGGWADLSKVECPLESSMLRNRKYRFGNRSPASALD